ncbi:MAG TPA: hypothetical protein VFG53_02940 [Anaeromyxobacter sp.]|nr:hypothetical protein [Anaeromyxobacter sp.]
MTPLHAVLFLHVLAAATWLGAALWTAGDVRKTLALGKPYTDALPRRVRPALYLDLWMGVATLLTGIAAIGLEGGVPRTGVLVGFVAVLVRIAVLVLGVRPAYRSVEAALGQSDLSAAGAPARRLGMLAGIAHLLWVVALAGMVFPF